VVVVDHVALAPACFKVIKERASSLSANSALTAAFFVRVFVDRLLIRPYNAS